MEELNPEAFTPPLAFKASYRPFSGILHIGLSARIVKFYIIRVDRWGIEGGNTPIVRHWDTGESYALDVLTVSIIAIVAASRGDAHTVLAKRTMIGDSQGLLCLSHECLLIRSSVPSFALCDTHSKAVDTSRAPV